jgi:hypothetical protein
MPKVKQVYHRTTLRKRRRHMVKQSSLLAIAIAIVTGVVFFGCLLTQTVSTLITDHNQYVKKTYHPSGSYILTRKPTINADFINSVLDYYHSPAHGKGEALYADGLKYGIDPAFALAFFMHESDLGTRGVATVTHSLGNIRASDGYDEYNGYRKYTTWEEGFDDWYKLISQLYIQKWGLVSVDQIIPVYAPAADNNDEQAYIYSVKYMVDTWSAGQVDVG